jgi:hypothetical protein
MGRCWAAEFDEEGSRFDGNGTKGIGGSRKGFSKWKNHRAGTWKLAKDKIIARISC